MRVTALTILERAKANPGLPLVFEGDEKDQLVEVIWSLFDPAHEMPEAMKSAQRVRLVPYMPGNDPSIATIMGFDWYFDP